MRISACLITKNEGKNIERCINSFKDVVDEIIVVDTGSDDNTVETARKLGALVYHFGWNDNFADARNFALDKAKYRWVLFLDADEYFINDTQKNIKTVIEQVDSDNDIDAICCRIINMDQIHDRLIDSARVIRVFRNTRFNRYVNAIHECIRKKNAYDAGDKLIIKHTGYSADRIKDKHKRNLGPLLQILEKGNKNFAYFYLADCYAGLGDFEQAIKYAKLFIASGMQPEGFSSKAPQVMISCMIGAGYDKEVILNEIDKWLNRFPGHPAFVSFQALVYYRHKEYDNALDSFKKALDYKINYKGNEFVKNIYSVEQIYYIMGIIYGLKNDYNNALECCVNSLRQNKYYGNAFNMTIGIIKYQKPEDIIAFLNRLYDINNEKDVDFLVSRLSNLKFSKVLLYYNDIWRNAFGKVDNTLMFTLLSNHEFEEAFRFFYQCFSEEKNGWIEKFTVISALLGKNEINIKKIKNEADDSYKKIIDLYCNNDCNDRLEKEDTKYLIGLIYEFILICDENEEVERLINLKNKSDIDISNTIGDIFRGFEVYDWAIEQYRDALNCGGLKNEDIASLYFKIGFCYYKLYKYEDAVQAFEKAIEYGYKDNDVKEFLRWISLYSDNDYLKGKVAEILEKAEYKMPDTAYFEVAADVQTELQEYNSDVKGLDQGLGGKIIKEDSENSLLLPDSYVRNNIKNILYLGWLGQGNVGDEVLFELFKSMFYKYHKPICKNSVVNIDAYSLVQNYKMDVSTYDLVVLGGGSIIHLPFWLKICADAIKHKVPVVSWGTGIDGFFRKENITSIKLSERNLNQFRSIYEQFDYISVRGPFTKNILINSAVKREVHVIGDPALAYVTEMFADKLKVDNCGRKRSILINWGTSNNNIFGGNELAVEEELVTVIHSLILKGYTVTVYPIWTEDINSVKRLAGKVNDNRCQAITEVYEAKILQKLISQSYFSINLKLHANILSAAADKPFILLAYRGKCFDFANTVNCLDYTIPTDQATSEKILKMVKNIENNYSNIVKSLKTSRMEYYPRLVNSIYAISDILNKTV